MAVAVHGWTDGRKKKLPKGLGVALVLSHVDPQGTEEKQIA